MVSQEVLSFHHSLTNVTSVTSTQALVLALQVEPHVVGFVGHMIAQGAQKLAVFCPSRIQAHKV